MYPRVACITCGQELGCLHVIYEEEKRRLLNEAKIDDQYLEDMILDTQTNIEMGEILDKLGLIFPCCRRDLLTPIYLEQYFA